MKTVNLNQDTQISKPVAFKLAKVAEKEEHWEQVKIWLSKIEKESLNDRLIGQSKWNEKVRYSYYMLKALVNTNEYQQALLLANDLIPKHPGLKNFFLKLKAKSLFGVGNFHEAESIYKELLKNPHNIWLLREYSEVLENLGKEEEALDVLYHLSSLRKELKFMVGVYNKIGMICSKLGRELEAYLHFKLCKLVREREKWSIKDELITNIQKFQGKFGKDSSYDSLDNLISRCEAYWQKSRFIPQDQKITKSRKSKSFQGIIHLGYKECPYCFINSGNVSIFCSKNILNPNISDKDIVICDTVPAFDKKKNKESWKAIKVERYKPKP